MIERANVRRSGGSDAAAFGIDHDVIGIDIDFFQHGGEQGGFILAVAIAVRKGFVGRMRLPAADPEFDGHVANILLHELGKGLHFGKLGGLIRGEFGDFLFDGGRGIAPILQAVRYTRRPFPTR